MIAIIAVSMDILVKSDGKYFELMDVSDETTIKKFLIWNS